jgi:ABC-type uncharacterized transport system permease subunit
VFQITILFLYLIAALAFAFSRFPKYSDRARPLVLAAFFLCAIALVIHGRILYIVLIGGSAGGLSMASAVSLIGLELGLIGLLGAFVPALRGLSASLLLLAALTSMANVGVTGAGAAELSWQLRAHVVTSMFAYGLLAVGAIVALYALLQDRRLRSGQLSSINHLFAPMETSEKLLYAITASGLTVLALSVVSGITFVEDLFAQHLVHKTVLSLLALLLFGVLLLGRRFAGWRGKRAVYLYLASFVILSLAYFGSRYILEEVLGRSWG